MAAFCLLFASGVLGRNQWTAAEANAWYARQPWMVGANYIPASAVNQLEMWQAATFNPEQIDRELGWAQRLGMNTMRVFLHDLLWEQDAAAFQQRVAAFLAICARHHIRVLFVLFDSDWQAEPKLGPQNPPIPGIHNSGWVQSPGLTALQDTARQSRLERYVQGMIGAFATDERIVGWDLWNEPSGTQPQVRSRVEELLPEVFSWARSANPTQPLTSGVFQDAGWTQGQPSVIEKVQLEQSDVLSFHDYHWPESLARKASMLLKRGRPVWCTEYLARGVGSTFDGSLPVGKELNVAMINWGLVDGKTQTRLPWDSWQLPYVNGREPAVWHHDIFHPDGTAYRAAEVQLIRALATAPRGVVPGRERPGAEQGGGRSEVVPQK
ncbi:MAG: cellulase family glycosylhydrolase [Sinobacteraceae bacterium]|nr:cellulase family glycosylhydrolase [Nevskiaceae bacterium]